MNVSNNFHGVEFDSSKNGRVCLL